MKTGFTMIEFLVVIVILGILAVSITGNYISSLSKGRDAKAIEDMQSLQKGFETYYALNNKYDSCNTMGSETRIFPKGLPVADAKTPYTYAGNCATGGDYCVCAKLIEKKRVNSGANCDFSNATKDYYCVINLQ